MPSAIDCQRQKDRIYLVSCVSRKRSTSAKAKDLYMSPLFTKSRAYVELMGQPWYILSAKYGLVHPDTVIEPYEKKLKNMRVDELQAWAQNVHGQLEPHLDGVRSVVFLAGKLYRQHLEPSLRERGIDVSVPMEGLPIGKQLSWLNRHLQS